MYTQEHAARTDCEGQRDRQKHYRQVPAWRQQARAHIGQHAERDYRSGTVAAWKAVSIGDHQAAIVQWPGTLKYLLQGVVQEPVASQCGGPANCQPAPLEGNESDCPHDAHAGDGRRVGQPRHGGEEP